jgi:YD repeat-containing protein
MRLGGRAGERVFVGSQNAGSRKARKIVVPSLLVVLVAGLAPLLPQPSSAAAGGEPTRRPIPPVTSPPTSLTPTAPTGDGGYVAPPTPEIPAHPPTPPVKEVTGWDPADSIELPTERTAKNKVYANPDGTRTTRAFSAPVHTQDRSGRWVDIDTKLDTADGRLRPKAAPGNPDFALTADDPALAAITLDAGHGVRFGLRGAERSPGVVTGSKVTYPAVLPATSLTLTVKGSGVKEELVLASPDAPRTFDFPIRATGLTPAIDPATGDVVYRDESGAERLRTPHGWMRDSAVGPNKRRGELGLGVTYALLADEQGGQVLRMTLDDQWLDDPARVWPVVVDPSYWLSTDWQDDTFVKSGITRDAAWEDWLEVGTENGGANIARSYMNFDVSGLDWRHILYARFFVYETYAPSCSARGLGVYRVTQAWNGHTMTSFEPGAATYGERVAWAAFAMGAPGCPAGWASWDLLDTVNKWTHGTWPDFGLMMRADPGSETDNNAYKEFLSWDGGDGDLGQTEPPQVPGIPHIDIVWNAAPSNPTLHSPGNWDTAHNLRPTLSASSSDINNDTLDYLYEICGVIAGVNQCAGSGWQENLTSWQVPEGWLAPNQSYNWKVIASDGTDQSGWSETRTLTPTNQNPTVPTLHSPVGTDAVVGSSTLLFTANAASDGNPEDTLKYRFQVATGSDGQTGRIATSTWQTGTTWSPPPGTFSDGGTYYWTVQAQDPWGATTSWQTPQQFRIDFRLGKRDTMPYDTLGPATVNLSNGNLVLNVEGPSFPTVGGPVGVGFSYNSQSPVVHGMVGDYHQDLDADGTIDQGEPNLLHRIDSALNFSWGSPGDGPNPGVLNPEHWVGHWTGAIRVPAGAPWGEDDYVFVSDHSDDSVTLRTGGPTGTVVLSAPGCCQYVSGSSVRLSPTSATALDLVYNQVTGPQLLRIKIRKASAPAGSEIDIPSDWLFTTTPALPDGWSRSADSPIPSAYTSVRPVTGLTTAVVDDDGTDHLYTWTGSSWAPPAGEDGVLSQLPNGTWSLSGDDGYLYSFRADGRVSSIVSAVDDVKPGAPVYAYEPTIGGVLRLRTIKDEAANRAITLSYAPSAECPAPLAGYDATAPADMLCKVSYGGFDGTETRLYYSGGHLARIVNPGAATIDFGYDSAGLLRSIRNALTNDLIASGTITDGTADKHKTLIDYDASGRVTSIKTPVPSATTPEAERTQHTYGYTVNSTTKLVTRATVDIAGLTGGTGQPADARVVDLDSGGHATRDVDMAGIAVDTVWDNLNDRPNRVTDGHYQTSPAGGLVTTTKYDAAGRVVDVYGPALAGEFAADGTSTTAPRVHTNYDEGMPGLAAAWYPTSDMTGVPKAHTTSSLNESWGSGSPASGVPADGFSGQLTGEITVPGGSAATLTLNADGGRIYVNGALAAGDTWGGPYRSAVRADNPNSHWRLGDSSSSTTAADAGGYSPGTYTGGVTKGATGTLVADGDKAAAFDGTTGYVSASNLDGDFSASFTVEAWAKFDAVNRGVDNAILGHGTAVHRQGLHIGERSGKPYFGFYGDDLAGTTPLSANTWYHLAFVYDGPQNAQRIYVNGVLDSQRNPAGGYQGPGATARIGSYPFGGSAFMDGTLDEVAVYRSALSGTRVAAHHAAAALTAGTATATVQPGTHKLRVDYQELVGNAALSLTSSVAGTTFGPRYNLVTSRQDADNRWVKTEYAAPHTGLATATVTDPVTVNATTTNPSGLNLRSTTTYEAASSSTFFRRTAKTLPKGAASTATYAYYGITETADNPCPGGQLAVNQAGALKSETAADPDGAGAQAPVVREFRYDKAGRIVARRVVGDSAWTCTSFDDRGRVLSRTDSSGKTSSYTYTQADRVTEVATGSDGTSRTTVSSTDWLGRSLAYTDELGTVTRRGYDRWGRLIGVFRAFSGQPETTLETTTYNSVGRMVTTTEHLSGSPRTTTYTYNAAGQLTGVTRPNGVVTTTGYHTSRGWVTSLSNTRSNTELSQWTYGHSPSGDVTSEVATTRNRTRTFGFDGAGRLTGVTGTTARSYAYDANTNRCARAASCATPEYTYDNADRLLSSPDYSAYTYDSHGNTTSATPRTQPAAVPISDSFSFDGPSSPRNYPIVVGQAGTVQANFDWTDTGTAVSTATTTGSLGLSPASTTAPSTTGPKTVDTELKGSLSWTKALHRPTDWNSLSVSGGSSATKQFTTDATGDIVSTLDWGVTNKPLSDSGTVSNTTTTTTKEGTFTASANGQISLVLTWDLQPTRPDLELDLYDDTTGQLLAVSRNTNALEALEEIPWTINDLGTVGATRRYRWKVHAKVGSSSSFSLSGTYPVSPTMDLRLEDTSGNVLANSTTVAGTRRRNLTKTAAPAGTYVLRASSADHAATPSLTTTYSRNDWANLNLVLKKGSTTVASTSSSAGQVTLSRIIAPADSNGTFTWAIENTSNDLTVPSFTLNRTVTSLVRDTASGTILPLGTATTPVVSHDGGSADFKLDWTAATLGGLADLTMRVKRSNGVLVAETRSTSGSVTLPTTLPAADTYSVEIVNNSATVNVPSYTLNTRVPRRPPVTVDMALKDKDGNTVATAGGTKPRTLSASVAAGNYTLVVTPTGGKANATLSGNHPNYARRFQITYDANDHATRVEDGRTVIAETLAPSGRVLKRTVTDAATNAVLENTEFGYDGPGDSPAYSRPIGVSGGTVTTYLGDRIYVGTTGTWQIVNLHGDVVGTTNAAGTFTAHPDADEFGIGQVPADRLGWLGGKDRFSVGGTLGLVRMGVRLYDTSTGRFLSVDPVEGGNFNDYEYCGGDPINCTDLDGQWSLRGVGRWILKNRGMLATVAAGAVCLGSAGAACGVAMAGAYAVRAQQRVADHGFRKSLGANVADGVLTLATFGMVRAPGKFALEGNVAKSGVYQTTKFKQWSLLNRKSPIPLWQRGMAAGLRASPSAAHFAGCRAAGKGGTYC